MLPIYDHRRIVGYAKSEKQALRLLRGLLNSIPVGWKVTVRLRDTEIIDLPAGWVYSVHP